VSLTWNGAAVSAEIERGIERGVAEAAHHLLEQANRHVPEDPDRRLERSGKVSTDGDTAAVSYDTDYAVIQHERLDYHHEPGREAKWLERTGNAERRELAEIVAARIRAALGH
jgi:hypothetical protein